MVKFKVGLGPRPSLFDLPFAFTDNTQNRKIGEKFRERKRKVKTGKAWELG